MFQRSPHTNLQNSDHHAANDDVEKAKLQAKLKFLRLPAVLERTGLSRSALYRLVATDDFPAPVKLTKRTSAWVESEVEAWNVRKVLERDGHFRQLE
ncbi:MAG: AlpA family transcriptional regulator [Deltaproteobacteria bacterium]|nr:AlpA family transcriptional regulator [Deltaproteobacteria bacterium]